jgi:hypothetical protein
MTWPQSLTEGGNVDTLWRLASLIRGQERIASPRMLQTVMFLAQSHVGKQFYSFRTSHGKVVSDELDQDAAYLEARGILSVVCSVADGKVEFLVNQAADPRVDEFDETGEVQAVAMRLFQEKSEVLEGAASMCRMRLFDRERSLNRLSWYQKLDPDAHSQAEALYKELIGERVAGEDHERQADQEGV